MDVIDSSDEKNIDLIYLNIPYFNKTALDIARIGSCKSFVAHPAVQNAPLILETPGMEPEHGREVAMLSKMRDKVSKK